MAAPVPGGTTPKTWEESDQLVYHDAGTTLATNGQTVQQWNDQSGNAINFAQGTSGNRPVYVTNVYNGLPTIQFTNASSNFMDASTGTIAQANTFLIVGRIRTLGHFNTIIDTNGSPEQAFLAKSDNTWDIYAGSDVGTGIAADTNLHIWIVTFNGASSKFEMDCGGVVLTGNAGTNSLGLFRLGSNPSPGSYADMDVLAVIAYDINLGATEKGQLQSKYVLKCFSDAVWTLFAWSDASSTLQIYQSLDGTFYSPYTVTYTPPSGQVNDTSGIFLNGATKITYTTNGVSKSTSFGFCTIGSIPWMTNKSLTPTFQCLVDCTPVTGSGDGARAWAPEGLVDATATQGWRVYVACSSTGDVDTGFQICETHPTSSDELTWSTVAAVGGLSSGNYIDPFDIIVSATYYIWLKNETSKKIEVWVLTSATGGATLLYNDPAGLGTLVEGPCMIQRGTLWYLEYDAYGAGTGTHYVTQTVGAGDWTGTNANAWSSPVANFSPGVTLRHGTVTSTPVPSVTATPGVALGTGTASNPAISQLYTASPGVALGTGTAVSPTVVIIFPEGIAFGQGTATSPAVIIVYTATPGVALGTGTIVDPPLSFGPLSVTVGTSLGSGTATSPTVTFGTSTEVPGVALGTGTAVDTSANYTITAVPGVSFGSGLVVDAAIVLGVLSLSPGTALGAGAAVDPTASHGALTVVPDVALGTGIARKVRIAGQASGGGSRLLLTGAT